MNGPPTNVEAKRSSLRQLARFVFTMAGVGAIVGITALVVLSTITAPSRSQSAADGGGRAASVDAGATRK